MLVQTQTQQKVRKQNLLKVKLKSFDVKLLDKAARQISRLCDQEKVSYSGPIPLPVKREIITILRSVHVNKKSREQFEMRTHKRIIVIENPSQTLIAKFNKVDLPASVNVMLD